MSYIFSIYSMLFLVTALLSFYVSYLAWRRKRVKGAKELAFMMIAAGVWAFADLFEISVTTQAQKILWSKIEYFGSVLTPVLYLLFVFKFTGVNKISQSRLKYIFFLVPLITLGFVLTNEMHNLIWIGFSEIAPDTNIMQYFHGVWFYIGYMTYNYILMFIATILLLRFILSAGNSFQKQAWIIVTGSIMPLVASVIYLSNSNFLPGLSITPLSFTVSGILLIYAILYFRLLDLVPVARELLVETLPDGILVLDEHGRIQDINASALNYLGIQTKVVPGLSINKCNCSEKTLLEKIRDEKANDSSDVRCKNQNRIISVIKKNVAELPGSKLVILRDVTDEREYEQKLKRRDELLFAGAKISSMLLTEEETNEAVRKAINILGEASAQHRTYLFECTRELESDTLLVSQRYEWTREGIPQEIGNPGLQNIDFMEVAPYSYDRLSKGLIVDAFVKDLPESERDVLEAQGIVSLLLVPIYVDGKWWGFIGFDNCESEYKWLEGEKALLGTVASSIGGAIGRMSVRESLRMSEERYRTIIGVSNTGAWEYNSENDTLWCSPEYITMLGYVPEEFTVEGFMRVEKMWTYFVHPDDRVEAERKFKDYLLSDTHQLYENYFRMKTKDGKWVWIWSRGRTIRDKQGELTNLTVGTHIDITERKRVEEELIIAKEKAERGDRLKTEFIHNISHEIRTPLNGILGFAQLIIQPDMSESDKHEYTKLLFIDSERLIATIDDYLDISLLSSANMKMNKSFFSLRILFDEIYHKFNDDARAKNLLLILEYPDELLELKLYSDHTVISKAIRHIVKNAIKFTYEGEVTLGCRKEEDGVEIYIRDTGIGISYQNYEKIFEPFVQVDTSTKKKFEGSGLGLAIAKGLVELANGRISVKSKEGHGSEFLIHLPLA
ncbi:MAG: histidine kinase N-terminal 7TM domain-containing protein [Ignavibacteriaceae bacterium]|jgi:PAS domain S-box-containing protein|nr:histidine kinase N-terminal 7TM domain-containing protein [Ignavibacteriaceae bacterium]HPO54457.1 histidine kinase N-terminal 7TM domain-containing protein [Ignavibacteriaceae bacterium]